MTSRPFYFHAGLAIFIVTVLAFLAATGGGIFGWSLAAAITALAWVAFAIRPEPNGARLSTAPRWQHIEWAYLALLLFLIMVLVPLPLALTTVTGPDRYAQNCMAALRLRQAEALDVITLPNLLFSTTRNRAGTLRVLAIVVGAFSTAELARRLSAQGRRLLLYLLIAGGALITAAGIVSLHILPQGNTLWWSIQLDGAPGPGSAACFVNQNHFGGFAAMLCPAAVIGVAIAIGKRRWAVALLMIVCAMILAAAAPLAESRGGVVAGGATLLLLPLFFVMTRHRRVGLWLIIITATLLTAIAVTVLPRVESSMLTILTPTQTASLQQRMLVWQESVDIWRHYPLVGAGPNSFHAVYPMYRASSVTGHRTHAENLYAETLADSGTIGCAIAIWIALAVFAGLYHGYRERTVEADLTFSACAAIMVAGIHALVDFATYVPLYSLTLGAMVGLALPSPSIDRRQPARLITALCALLIVFVSPVLAKRDSVYALPDTDVDILARSIVWAPTSQHAWFYAGRQMLRSRKQPVRRLGERFMTQSMVYDPMNYRHWRKLGEMRLRLKERNSARKAYERAHALRDWVKVPPELREES